MNDNDKNKAICAILDTCPDAVRLTYASASPSDPESDDIPERVSVVLSSIPTPIR